MTVLSAWRLAAAGLVGWGGSCDSAWLGYAQDDTLLAFVPHRGGATSDHVILRAVAGSTRREPTIVPTGACAAPARQNEYASRSPPQCRPCTLIGADRSFISTRWPPP